MKNVPSVQPENILQVLEKKKSQTSKYLMNLLDPWNAVNAKLPQIGDSFSNTAKVKSYFNLTANAGGYLMLYFDPNYVASASSYTAFCYTNHSSLNGSTTLAGSYWYGGPTNSVPSPPSSTVLKTRLVSAGMKVVPKISNMNYVATALACLDYGDYGLLPPGITLTTQNANVAQYTSFANIINGCGSQKYDLSNTGQSVYFNWYPVDPLSDIYIDVGNYMIDNATKDAGGSPRFVLGLQDLPANAPVDIEIVWNIEYLAAPTMKSWLGYSPPGMSNSQFLQIKDALEKNEKIKLTSSGEIIRFNPNSKGGIW